MTRLVSGGQLQFTRPPLVPVACFENGGSYRSALSLEPFVAAGPWTIGTDGSVAQQGIAGNQLVSGGARTITYKVAGTAQQAGRITGTLGMSFVEERPSSLITSRTAQIAIASNATIQTSTTQKRILSSITLVSAEMR